MASPTMPFFHPVMWHLRTMRFDCPDRSGFSLTIQTNYDRLWRNGLRIYHGCVSMSGANFSTVTLLIGAADRGDRSAADALFSTLYSELHRLAKRELARQSFPVNLSATTLLHQAYLGMAEREGPTFPDRARFMGYAARVMRGLIIDHARNRQAQKRGGQFEITSLPTDVLEGCVDYQELKGIGETLEELARVDPALAEIVDLKFFCGFSFAEIAAMRAVSERTVQRNWDKARIYLHRKLRTDLSL
jgi:RNA polymerase sigma factor (TIGR02999 family)